MNKRNSTFTYREATTHDIPQMHKLRMSVKENMLSNPLLVTEKDYIEKLNGTGKGWVAENNANILGFAIADYIEKNIWALFVDPDYEKRGIGRTLHDLMLNYSFAIVDTLWLTTDPRTRAAKFYALAGWNECGITRSGEMRFEISKEAWARLRADVVVK